MLLQIGHTRELPDMQNEQGIDFNKVTIMDALSAGLKAGSDGLMAVERQILQAINQAKQTKAEIMLVLDGIDFLLAASACPLHALLDMVGELRDSVQSTIITVCADSALLQTQVMPLETAHAALVMSLAHQARMVMSGRELDTGGARDVSGVLRITGGGGEWGNGSGHVEERECLYYVGGDGGVRVFERGA